MTEVFFEGGTPELEIIHYALPFIMISVVETSTVKDMMNNIPCKILGFTKIMVIRDFFAILVT